MVIVRVLLNEWGGVGGFVLSIAVLRMGKHLRRKAFVSKLKCGHGDNAGIESLPSSLLDSLLHQRAESRSKKNYNPAACGTKTTFMER